MGREAAEVAAGAHAAAPPPCAGTGLSRTQLGFSPLTATRTRTSPTRTRTALLDPARRIVPTTLDPACGVAPDRTTSTTIRTRTHTHTAHPSVSRPARTRTTPASRIPTQTQSPSLLLHPAERSLYAYYHLPPAHVRVALA
ncbi:hypothetical protein K438DRAFT_1991185 [Mycena galopus ATCC 62051]|nr:hypothetical protein K438DRAFT_1991185 [Mycena galopus ATCC 62051]